MRTGEVIVPSNWDNPWIALDTTRDGNVPGPVWKPLSVHEETGACTYLIHLPPNWNDQVCDWHPGAEEAWIIDGATSMGFAGEEGSTVLQPGHYCYRPPGILHGPAAAPSVHGATIFQRMSSEVRILRYDGDEFPNVNLQPINDDHKTWPVEWNEQIKTEDIPFADSEGPWAGTQHKWIWRNTETGGGCVLLDLPAGWSGDGSPAVGSLEEFVLEGSLTAGGVEFGLWGYAHRPAGSPAGSYSTAEGAKILCYWDESNEFTGEAR